MSFRTSISKLTSGSQSIIIAFLLLLLPLLAVLQYRWLGQLSADERTRMKTHLQALAMQLGQDFDREITHAYATFVPISEMENEDRLSVSLESYARWSKESPYPGLVKSIFLAEADEQGQLYLSRLNQEARTFEPLDWPQTMATLRSQLEGRVRNPHPFGPPSPGRAGPFPRSVLVSEDELPSLVLPILEHGTFKDDRGFARPHLVGYAIVELDLSYIQHEMLPALIKRHFDSTEDNSYDLIIVARSDQQRIIYQSGSEGSAGTATALSSKNLSSADADTDLFRLRPNDLRDIFRTRRRHGEMHGMYRQPPRHGPPAPFYGAPGLLDGEQAGLWQIHIRHHAGSLDAAVARVRRRNLLISFGILALLGASVALLIVSARRARRLAEQQMDFVAGVSHELRTPLAVIESAAYNLDKGVISAPREVMKYGALIRRETGGLKEMVEQILEFAGAQLGRSRYHLQAVSIKQILDDVLLSSEPLLTECGIKIESVIDPNLPHVMADQAALARAIRNLITNAIKYSGKSQWIGLEAKVSEAAGCQSVLITVADKGIGIPAGELNQIFEPFYRGGDARAAQIHGNGLGLSLVKNIISAHNGRIDVMSAPGAGTIFTIVIPALVVEVPTVANESSYEQANFVSRR